jgi:hypothetical protein
MVKVDVKKSQRFMVELKDIKVESRHDSWWTVMGS